MTIPLYYLFLNFQNWFELIKNLNHPFISCLLCLGLYYTGLLSKMVLCFIWMTSFLPFEFFKISLCCCKYLLAASAQILFSFQCSFFLVIIFHYSSILLSKIISLPLNYLFIRHSFRCNLIFFCDLRLCWLDIRNYRCNILFSTNYSYFLWNYHSHYNNNPEINLYFECDINLKAIIGNF